MKTIGLEKEIILLDDEDFEKLKHMTWCALRCLRTTYAVSNRPGRGNGLILLHRLIMNPPKGVQVDHINGNGLDNRRENLRLATNQQNSRNQRKQKRATRSQFKGVSFDPRPGRQNWVAYIKINGKKKHLGVFPTELAAAREYDRAALAVDSAFFKVNGV